MSDEPAIGPCVVCRHPRRIPNQPPVCDNCRTALISMLGEIPDLFARLDPSPQTSGAEKVSGSREAPIPVAVDVVDLTSPARTAALTITGPDQLGYLSVATELDFWVLDWRLALWPNHSIPLPTVTVLSGWLRNRVDHACDHHPAIDEFATKVRQIHKTLRRMVGELRHVHRLPAPCPTCELSTLVRADGASYVECTSCRRLWTEEDYRRLSVVLAAEQGVA